MVHGIKFFAAIGRGSSRLAALLLLLCCLWPQNANAATERITLFDVRAWFEPDGSMRVRENISVQAAGSEIRRGITREIPLVWNRADNRRFLLSCEVTGVSRNGNPEPYTLKQDGQELFLRIGNPDKMLAHGAHTYSIEYVLRNHFSRFEGWDELYYNVTGNNWRLSIDEARFSLAMPSRKYSEEQIRDIHTPPPSVRAAGSVEPPLPFYSIDAYTGYAGERGGRARVLQGEVHSTARLKPGEGLTVAYTWPRWILRDAPDPVEYSPLLKGLLPQLNTLPLFAVPLLLALLYARILLGLRRRHGGPMPAIIPLFSPPDGLTPGQMRFALTGSYGIEGFASDILRLVSLGAMKLEKGKGSGKRGKSAPVLVCVDGAEKWIGSNGKKLLNHRDQHVLGQLFSEVKKRVSLGTAHQNNVRHARNYLARKVEEEQDALFVGYKKPLLLCIPAVIALPVLGAVLYRMDGPFLVTFVIGFIAMFAGVLLFMSSRMIARIGSLKEALARLPFLLFTIPFWLAIGVMASQLFPLVIQSAMVPDGFYGALLLCLLCPVFYGLLAPKLTALGRERLAQAKGMVMYMAAAEKHRMEALYPPELTVEHFEKLLPYAFALGVGKTWAETFAGYLARVGAEAANFRDFSWNDARSFQSGLGSAASSPGGSSGSSGGGGGSSGSGSGGGGSSGGGSGGGGGGGW